MNPDSSGTEDDLPNHGIIRTSRVVFSEARRPPTGAVFYKKQLPDMNSQIHGMEIEAYGSVMRAFCGQSESLTWSKETLMSDLRKELRLSDDEHREILAKINSDESIKALREWRTNTDAVKLTTTNSAIFDPVSMSHMPRKKLKNRNSYVLPSRRYPPSTQPSPASALAVNVRKDLLGSNTGSFAPHMNVGQAVIPVHQNRQATSTGKVRGSLAVQTSNRSSLHSGSENLESDIIKILHTEKLIYEVEKACGAENPDPVQVQKAKLLLREHERALTEAIKKLADLADGGETTDQRGNQYSGVAPQRNEHSLRLGTHKKLDRTKCYYTGYVSNHPGRLIPVVDLPDEE